MMSISSSCNKHVSHITTVVSVCHGHSQGPSWPWSYGWQTLSHNVAHLALIEIRTHNISGNMHWLIGYVVINPTTIRSRPRRPLAVTMTNGNYSGNMWHMFVTGPRYITEILLQVELKHQKKIKQTITSFCPRLWLITDPIIIIYSTDWLDM
jgi:hypothetical protein